MLCPTVGKDIIMIITTILIIVNIILISYSLKLLVVFRVTAPTNKNSSKQKINLKECIKWFVMIND